MAQGCEVFWGRSPVRLQAGRPQRNRGTRCPRPARPAWVTTPAGPKALTAGLGGQHPRLTRVRRHHSWHCALCVEDSVMTLLLRGGADGCLFTKVVFWCWRTNSQVWEPWLSFYSAPEKRELLRRAKTCLPFLTVAGSDAGIGVMFPTVDLENQPCIWDSIHSLSFLFPGCMSESLHFSLTLGPLEFRFLVKIDYLQLEATISQTIKTNF